MADKETFPLTELVAEARRELLMRNQIYPRMIREETLAPLTAERRIALQEAIVATLAALLGLEEGQQELFGGPA